MALALPGPVALPVVSYGAGPFYVSPTGSDSGGDGSLAHPWQTPQYAKNAISAGGSLTNMSADVTLYLMPGDYWLGEGTGALKISNDDSGTNGHTFVVRALSGINTVRLLGGKRVTGWALYSGSIYRAAVTGTFSTLYENGVRANNARYPAQIPDITYPMARTPYLLSEGVNGSQTVLQYKVGDLISPNLWDLGSARLLAWSGGGTAPSTNGRAWTTDDIPILSVNAGTRQLTVNGTANFPYYAAGVGSRYFAQGDLSFLVGPGQWYHDVAGGWLYYWPNSTPIALQEIVIPTMTRAVSVKGSGSGRRVSHVSLIDLEVEYGDYATIWEANDATNVLTVQRNGLVTVENATNVLVDRCNVHNSGMHGVLFYDYSQNNTIQNSWIHNTGAVGLYYLNEPSHGLGDVSLSNTSYNCRINNTGELVGDGHCFYSINSGSGSHSYLDIYNSVRSGIATEGQYPTTAFQRNNVFDHIKIRNVCQDSGDQGGLDINSTGDATHQSGDTYSQIILDGTIPNSSMTDIANPGIFGDTNSCSQTYQNFQVTNTQGAQYKTGDATGSVFTNTSFLSNGSANPSFNPALMDTANIGVTAGFPY